jgi:hypothetical protein
LSEKVEITIPTVYCNEILLVIFQYFIFWLISFVWSDVEFIMTTTSNSFDNLNCRWVFSLMILSPCRSLNVNYPSWIQQVFLLVRTLSFLYWVFDFFFVYHLTQWFFLLRFWPHKRCLIFLRNMFLFFLSNCQKCVVMFWSCYRTQLIFNLLKVILHTFRVICFFVRKLKRWNRTRFSFL